MRRLLLLVILLLPVVAHGQANGGQANPGIATSIVRGSNPSPCTDGQVNFVPNTGMTQCIAGVWTVVPTTSGGLTIGTTTITSGTNTRIIFDDNGVVGESGNFLFSKGDGSTATANLALTGTALPSVSNSSGQAATDSLDVTGTVGQATSLSSSSSRGGLGALISIIGGKGGDNTDAVNTTNSSNHRGGLGGAITFTSGAGGNATGSTGSTGARGGDAGAINLNGGNGGTTVNNVVGGAGGGVSNTGGIGGVSSGSAASGAGGGLTYTGGTGGANSNAAGTAGNGGGLTLDAGAAGAASGGAAAGTNGTVSIGATNASALTIGRSTVTTTINGTLVAGVTTATTLNKWTFTAPATGITLTGTDNAVYTLPPATATIARTDAGQTFTGVNTMTAPVFNTNISTPSIITAAGALTVTPAANAAIALSTTGVIQVGGTSSSFPGFKTASGVAGMLFLRLADDSGLAFLGANSLSTQSDVRIGGINTSTGANGNTNIYLQSSSSQSIISLFGTGGHPGIKFTAATNAENSQDLGVMRNVAGVLEVNNATAGTFRDIQVRNSLLSGTVTNYNNVATAGWGVPAVYGSGRSTAQTAAVASVATYTVGAADGSFEVSANVLVTASATHSFTVTVAYTDEGNTARTLTLNFSQITGTLLTAITNVQGVGAYEGVPLHIRCKASTSITIASTGTFTSVTYNIEGIIKQMA